MIKIRPFIFDDIDYKIRWINDTKNNKYLHYDLPITYEKTVDWYEKNKSSKTRLDLTIVYDSIPVGLIGLLDIDSKNKKAEFYIIIGESDFKNKGIAYNASLLLLERAKTLGLRRVYLYTEIDNLGAQKLFEKLNFLKEGIIKNDLFHNNKFIDRYIYSYDLFNN